MHFMLQSHLYHVGLRATRPVAIRLFAHRILDQGGAQVALILQYYCNIFIDFLLLSILTLKILTLKLTTLYLRLQFKHKFS